MVSTRQQPIDISCPPGAQQQTRSSGVQMMGQADARPFANALQYELGPK